MIVGFLKNAIREINEEKTSKDNFDFLELTFFEFIELRNKIEVKYDVMIKCVDIFRNNGVVELARRIETLMAIKELNKEIE